MSKLKKLIQELCPNGVPFVRLGDVCAFRKGASLSKADKGLGDTPIILYGELYTTYGDYIDEIFSLTSIERAQTATPAHKGNILLPISSTSKDAQIGKASALNVDYPVFIGGDAIILEHQQEPGYLVHLLNSKWFEVKKMKCVYGATIMHLHPKELAEICIPIPPLEVQREIVHILDRFTLLTAELTAELTARKKQYEYYSNKLLAIEDESSMKMLPLGDIVNSISSGKNKDRLSDGQYPVYGSTGIIAYTNKFVYSKRQILVARVGANAGYTHIAQGKYDVSDNTLIVDVRNNVNLKYLYYQLCNINLNKYAKGAGQPLVTAGQIKQIEIPIPSIDVQNRVVEILDRFDTLCNDISAGLPAEIEARQKQYEYYRDKLLTFKEIEV